MKGFLLFIIGIMSLLDVNANDILEKKLILKCWIVVAETYQYLQATNYRMH